MDLASVPTPRAFIDVARVRRNIAAMQALATRAGVRLRPHAKTHKSPVIARWQMDAGAVGICCAKLGEAEVFADAGIEDIRLPYPINAGTPDSADRVLALIDRVTLSLIVDDVEVARQWSSIMKAAGRKLNVLVKVDVGFHRCGIDPDVPGATAAVRAIAALPGLEYLGLLSHAGHSYGAHSADGLARIAELEIAILRHLANDVRRNGPATREISVGSTPTARFITDQSGATEMRPGTYVFNDRTQVGLGAAALEDCAIGIVSTVVSRPSSTRVIFDAGSKTLTNDAVRGFDQQSGHGLVFLDLAASEPDRSIVLERLSEEHATATVPESCALRPGDRVRILPNHACAVTNLMDDLLLVEGDEVVDQLAVAARGNIW